MFNVAVLMVSSKILQGEADPCRQIIAHTLTDYRLSLLSYEVLEDDRQAVASRLRELCDREAPRLILTVGGTGVRPTDWVPEATRDVLEREIPGIGEAMRMESLKKVRTAMLSRGTAGLRGQTLIINLPGSPKGVKENFDVVAPLLEHVLEKSASKN